MQISIQLILQEGVGEPIPPKASLIGQKELTDSCSRGIVPTHPTDGLSGGPASRDGMGFGGIKRSEGLFGSMAASSGESLPRLLSEAPMSSSMS